MLVSRLVFEINWPRRESTVPRSVYKCLIILHDGFLAIHKALRSLIWRK